MLPERLVQRSNGPTVELNTSLSLAEGFQRLLQRGEEALATSTSRALVGGDICHIPDATLPHSPTQLLDVVEGLSQVLLHSMADLLAKQQPGCYELITARLLIDCLVALRPDGRLLLRIWRNLYLSDLSAWRW